MLTHPQRRDTTRPKKRGRAAGGPTRAEMTPRRHAAGAGTSASDRVSVTGRSMTGRKSRRRWSRRDPATARSRLAVRSPRDEPVRASSGLPGRPQWGTRPPAQHRRLLANVPQNGSHIEVHWLIVYVHWLIGASFSTGVDR